MDPTEPWPPPDPVGEALHFLRMAGAFYCRSELTAPWGMTLPVRRPLHAARRTSPPCSTSSAGACMWR